MVVKFLWLLLTLQMVATLIKAFPRLADASYLDLFFCHESHNSNEGRHLWVGFWKLPLPHHAITDWWESQISQTRIFCFYSIIENIFVHPQMKFSIQTKVRLCIYNVSKCPVTMNSIFKDTLSLGKHARRSLKWKSNMMTSSPNSTGVLVSLYMTVYIQTLFENVPGNLEKGKSTCRMYVVLNQMFSHPANIQRTRRTMWKCRWFSIQSQGRIWTRTLNVWPRIHGVSSHSTPQSRKVGIWETRKENPACWMLYGCWTEWHTDVSFWVIESKPQMCVSVCIVHICSCGCRDAYWMPCAIALHLILFWDRVSHWMQSTSIWLGWPAN